MENNLSSILERFPKINVLVFGEGVLDSIVRGKASRLSLDAPAPVVDVTAGQDLAGGAANAAVNACRLGANAALLSIIGRDREGENLLALLRGEGIETRHVIRHPQRRTLLRRKIFGGDQLLVRYDQGSSDAIDAESEQRLLKEYQSLCRWADVVILSDYGQGLLTRRVLEGVAHSQEKTPNVLVADTRRLSEYQHLRLAAVRPSYNSVWRCCKQQRRGTTRPVETAAAILRLKPCRI